MATKLFNAINPVSSATPLATTEISQLRIYPIKSCRGIQLRTSTLTVQGLDLDRRWMFVDAETNKFLTIRDIPALTLIDTALASSRDPTDNDSADDLELVISVRNDPAKRVQIPARPTPAWLAAHTHLLPVEIWGLETDAYRYEPAINAVFAELVGRDVALVYKGPTPRILRGNGAPELLGREQSTNFPDVLPLQIASEASLAELNSRLAAGGHDEITVERFRPNIVVRAGAADGMPAWSEDNWKTVRVVDNKEEEGWLFKGPRTMDIDIAARCARCQVPNVEPSTAEKDAHEPWDTLVKYRRVDEGIKWKPCFGMLSVPRHEGRIAVGMKFELLETTEDHLYIKGF